MFQKLRKILYSLAITIAPILVFFQVIVLTPMKVDAPEEATLFEDMSSQSPNDVVQTPDQVIEGFTLVATDKEKIVWELRAKKAMLYQKMDLLRLINVDLDFYDKENKITNVKSSFGKVFTKTNDVQLNEKVVMLSPDGFVLRSEYAEYTFLTREILSPDFTTGYGFMISNASAVPNVNYVETMNLMDLKEGEAKVDFEGKNVLHNLNSEIINIRKEAKITENKKQKNQIINSVITGDVGVLYKKEQKANMIGNVVGVQGSMTSKGDVGDFFFGDADERIKYMILTGNVNIVEILADSSIRTAKSHTAEFYSRDDRIVLMGYPVINHRSDVMTGDVMTFYRNRDEIEIQQSNAEVESNSQGR